MAKTLPLELVEEMITNYKSKQYLSIVTNTINPMPMDAKSVWFELGALKQFIASIEYEATKNPEYDMKNFGVRFYYSAYPISDSWEDEGHEELGTVSKAYEKLHTLIAIPTAEINGVNSDFDPFDVATYTGIKPIGKGATIMAENHGNLCPPDSPVGLWF